MNHAWAYAAADKQIFRAACSWLALRAAAKNIVRKDRLAIGLQFVVGRQQQRVDVIAITPH